MAKFMVFLIWITLLPALPVAPVGAGASFPVTWQGPNNTSDLIAITDLDNAEKVHTSKYVNGDGKLLLTAPEEAGQYQVVYRTPQKRVLGKSPLTVNAVSARFDAIAPVGAGASFPVTWQGPNNTSDLIAITDTDSAGKIYTSAYVNKDGKVLLTAPKTAGQYQVVYRTPQKRVLAKTRLVVKP